jgi:hypothetical protein
MGLILPGGPDWGQCSHNIAGTPSLTGIGTQCTAGATNADGSAVTLLSALTHDCEYLRIGVSGETITATQNNTTLLSILYDPAGGTSWQTLIPSLLVATIAPSASAPYALYYDFPIWVPAGASIGAQARSAAATTPPVMRVQAQAFGSNRNPASWWCGQRVEAIGIDAANSRGTSHTAGNTGAFSSWANLGSPLSIGCGALQWGLGGTFNSATWLLLFYEFHFGVSSTMIGAPIMHSINTTEQSWRTSPGPIFRALPAGAQLMVRGTSSGTAAAQNVAAYAVY